MKKDWLFTLAIITARLKLKCKKTLSVNVERNMRMLEITVDIIATSSDRSLLTLF